MYFHIIGTAVMSCSPHELDLHCTQESTMFIEVFILENTFQVIHFYAFHSGKNRKEENIGGDSTKMIIVYLYCCFLYQS